MACKTETKQIGDNEYSVTQWPAEKALLMKFKITKALGAAFATLASADKKKKDPIDETKALSDSLTTLFQNTSPEELVSIMKSSIVGTARNGTKITESSFNEYFSGDDLVDIYKVFIFVLQVNFSNLFKGQLVESLLAKVKPN